MNSKIPTVFVVTVMVISMMAVVDIGLEVVSDVNATTIYVDDDGGADYTSIQDALDRSNDGDTIFVYSGTYKEDLRVEKRVILTGQGSSNTVIIREEASIVIHILIDNVQISGFKIIGIDQYFSAGIQSSHDNMTITNCEPTNNVIGIRLTGSSNHILKSNICRDNVREGIYLNSCDNVTLEDNDCFSNGYNGMFVHGGSDFIIKNNICYENEVDGIRLNGVSNAIIGNNNCYRNRENGIRGHGESNMTFKDNNCNGNTHNGIFTHGLSNFIIIKNQCNSNSDAGIYGLGGGSVLYRSNYCNYNEFGLFIYGLINFTAEFNACNYNRRGIRIITKDNRTIVNNNLFDFNSISGIDLWSCSNVTIQNNSCDDNIWYGIFSRRLSWNIFKNNSFNSNRYGLYMENVNNNTFSRNDFSENDYGIQLRKRSFDNVFSNNTISENKLIGMSIDYKQDSDPYRESKRNVFYHNNIINNTQQSNSTIPSNNHWHHQVLLEGNYWSDYTGIDDGSGMGKHAIAGDGIGDTEIPHPGLGFDFYPFIYSNGWNDSRNLPPTADAGPDQTVHIWQLVEFDGSNSNDPNGDNLTYEWDFGDGSEHGFGVNVSHVYNTTGVYNVALTVKDEGGLTDTDFCIITVLYPPSVPPSLYSMELSEGWNLISFPTIQSTSDITTLFESISGDYDAMQRYDADDPLDPWKHHVIGKDFENDLQDVDDTMGLWIHITKPGGTILLLNGIQLSSTPIIPLIKGWNLVGYPFMVNHTRDGGLNNLIFGTDVDAIQWFDSTTKTWHFLEEDDSFAVGRGYWIHATTDCTWEVPL